METVKVSSKGQVVIPKSIREAHRITAGTALVVTSVGDEIRMKPALGIEPTTVAEVAGCLYRKGRKKLTDSETKRRIAEMLKARDRKAHRG
jgi:AbrB family looped-hinge helix DNA binding protein